MLLSCCVILSGKNMGNIRVLDQISISAPSRLHFGLFSIGDSVARKFGGIGLMIDSPRTIVTASQSESLQIADGPENRACWTAIQNWFVGMRLTLRSTLSIDRLDELPVHIDVESVPSRHAGFGSGTQLALSSVTAVTRLLELPLPRASELAALIGRGKRSGIGSHGFCRGGFLVDRGKLKEERLAPLDFRTDFPESWTIVTVIIEQAAGLWGAQEQNAFSRLPGTSVVKRDEMIEIVRNRIIPGVLHRDFDLFSEGVYEFGHRSGMMFAEIQNGPYNGPQIEELIDRIREFGVKAVGQSSWGPCVFAITRNDKAASQLVEFVHSAYGDRCSIGMTKADNTGAQTLDRKPAA